MTLRPRAKLRKGTRRWRSCSGGRFIGSDYLVIGRVCLNELNASIGPTFALLCAREVPSRRMLVFPAERRKSTLILTALGEPGVAGDLGVLSNPTDPGVLLSVLDQLDLVAFGRVHESNNASTAGLGWTVGKGISLRGRMLRKCLKIVDLKREMSDVRAHVDRTAAIEFTNLDLFLASWRFEEDEFGAAWGFRTMGLFETEYVLIEGHSFLQVGYSIPGVQEFLNHRLENWHKWIARANNS